MTCCYTKVKEPSLPYLPMAGGRIVRFIPLPGTLALSELQTASFRIWTHAANSTFCDSNFYATSALKKLRKHLEVFPNIPQQIRLNIWFKLIIGLFTEYKKRRFYTKFADGMENYFWMEKKFFIFPQANFYEKQNKTKQKLFVTGRKK